jgi:glutamate dehydrogenase (NADP+)
VPQPQATTLFAKHGPLSLAAVSQGILAKVQARDPEQKEFLQAVEEVLLSLKPVLAKHPEYCAVLERMCEPERQIMFR